MGAGSSATFPSTIAVNTIPQIRNQAVHAVTRRAAVFSINVMLTRLFVVIRTTSVTAHLRLFACPDEDAHQAISPCLFPQRCVRLEIITRAHKII
jgi:hypothetical protein